MNNQFQDMHELRERLIPPARKAIYTETDQFTKANKDEDHFTVGLNPCLGIIFYNKKTEESYLFHTPYMKAGLIPRLIQMQEDSKADFKEFIVDCYGSSLDPDIEIDCPYNRSILEERMYSEEILRNTFPRENISFNWAKKGILTSVYLDKKKLVQYILTSRLFPDMYY